MSSTLALEFAAEAAAGRSFDLELVTVTDDYGMLTGYRLITPDYRRGSRLYLSREDALGAWIEKSIEWED